MRVEITEAEWLDERQAFSLAEIATLSGLSEAELQHLIDCETLSPSDPGGAADVRFGAHCLVTARLASRLRDDFDLDPGGLALALTLLDRIRGLEAQLRALHAQVPQRRRY